MYSFPNLEPVHCSMSSSNCCFLTCIEISQEAGKVVRYSYLLKNFSWFIVIYTVKDFGVINKAEVDVFLKRSCFFDDPADVGNLVSGSSVFSKTSLNIWNFMVSCIAEAWLGEFWALLYWRVRCVQLCNNLSIIWHCLSLGLKWKLTFFQSCGHCWIFQICWHIEEIGSTSFITHKSWSSLFTIWFVYSQTKITDCYKE